MSSSLVLGTAQIGFPYGIANKTGQPDRNLVREIMRAAWTAGIREFDTAQDYGESEEVLGDVIARLGVSSKARIISKIDPTIDHCSITAMSRALETTLEKLGVPSLFGLLLHDESLLSGWKSGIWDVLRGFIKSGKVINAGISVYSPDKAIEALHTDGINLVQVPSNILDRRFMKKGVFELAVRKKKQIYIRSVYLQGFIIMEPDDLPDYMMFARPVLDSIISLAKTLGITRHELALSYLRLKVPESKLVIGVETTEQLIENVFLLSKETHDNIVELVDKCFNNVEEKLLNPGLWRS